MPSAFTRRHALAREAGGAVAKRGGYLFPALHVRVDHVEIEPKPEFHALFFDALYHRADPLGKILFFEIEIRLIFLKPKRVHEVIFDPEIAPLVQFRHAGDRVEG